MSRDLIEAINRRAEAHSASAQAMERLARGLDRILVDQQEKQYRRRMMKRAVEIMRGREQRAAELRRLRAESQSDQYPESYRERMRTKLDAEITAVNAQAKAKLDAWAADMARDPQRRYNEGTRPSQEELLEAGQLAERYKGQQTMARNHLLPEARRLVQAGATSRAAVHYRAATILGLDDSRIAAALEDADPVKVAARDELHAIDLHRAVLDADIRREAGRFDADVSASIRDKFTAVRWGLTPAEQQTDRSYREMVLSSK